MSHLRLRSTPIALALLATLLLAPAFASAAPRSLPAVHAASGPGPGFLTSLWHTLRSLWGAAGPMIDPDGAHVNGTAGTGGGTSGMTNTSAAEGVSIDPNGAHVNGAQGTGSAMTGLAGSSHS